MALGAALYQGGCVDACRWAWKAKRPRSVSFGSGTLGAGFQALGGVSLFWDYNVLILIAHRGLVYRKCGETGEVRVALARRA